MPSLAKRSPAAGQRATFRRPCRESWKMPPMVDLSFRFSFSLHFEYTSKLNESQVLAGISAENSFFCSLRTKSEQIRTQPLSLRRSLSGRAVQEKLPEEYAERGASLHILRYCL